LTYKAFNVKYFQYCTKTPGEKMTEVPEHLLKRAEEARANANAKKQEALEEEQQELIDGLPDLAELIKILELTPEKIQTTLLENLKQNEKTLDEQRQRKSQIESDLVAIKKDIVATEKAIEADRKKIVEILPSLGLSDLHALADRLRDLL
jgi:hypothetical protein